MHVLHNHQTQTNTSEQGHVYPWRVHLANVGLYPLGWRMHSIALRLHLREMSVVYLYRPYTYDVSELRVFID